MNHKGLRSELNIYFPFDTGLNGSKDLSECLIGSNSTLKYFLLTPRELLRLLLLLLQPFPDSDRFAVLRPKNVCVYLLTSIYFSLYLSSS